MTSEGADRWRFAHRFGVRLGLILTLALAPVGIIAVVQTVERNDELHARTEATLAGATLLAAAPKLVELSELQAVSRGLALGLGALDDQECAAVLRSLAGSGQRYTGAAAYGLDGRARCSTDHPAVDISNSAVLNDFRANPHASLRLVDRADRDGFPLLVAINPITDASGLATGFVALGQQQIATSTATAPSPGLPGVSSPLDTVVLFDKGGNSLASTVDRAASLAMMPADSSLAELFGRRSGMFRASDLSGERRLYSLNVLIPGEIYAIGTWKEQRGLLGALRVVSPLVRPALTWAICLIAALVVSEMMVTRYMRRFRSGITAFAQGDRRMNALDMASAPTEIREAAEAFDHMTETILKDEAELENTLHEKEALLREVHHRVKNNLQLMASIINLQIRRTRLEEAKSIMRRLQDRMLSLATIHNSLFHTASLDAVRVDTLFSGLVDQVIVSGAGAGRRFDIETSFDPVSISPEQIVPLALLLTEALGRSMKAVAQNPGPHLPRIDVSLRAICKDSIRLDVTHIQPEGYETRELDDSDRDDAALGNQLIHAFALQLGGSYKRENDGPHEIQRVEFRLKPGASLPYGVRPQG